MLTFGSLFAGIEGFGIGLQLAGMECKWQVENDEFAHQVLQLRYPNVRKWLDVNTFPPRSIEFSYSWRGAPLGPFTPDVRRETTCDEWYVDVICGGFPCQNISNSGDKAGLAGDQSRLWFEFIRVVRMLRPKIVIVENVAALVKRGLSRVLGDLAAIGLDAEWESLPAAAFGADHIRERLFILAYPNGFGRQELLRGLKPACHKAYARREREFDSLDTYRRRLEGMEQRFSEPALCRTNDGLSRPVDRLRCLGNAVDVRVSTWIGQRIANHVRELNECVAI